MIETVQEEKVSDLEVVIIDNESFFRISDVNDMRPFLMSIVSDSDHWMFAASSGGISAGRRNAEFSLFPYYTDDKLIATAEITGSKTLFQVSKAGKLQLWEPFSVRNEGKFSISNNLYKNIYGNKVIFEEVNHDLELTFCYEWNSSKQYGFVRKSKLTNSAQDTLSISVIDGIQNILPYGVGSDLQNDSSNLVNAYKRSELEKASGLGIYALSAIIVDKAEPSEALKANVAWSIGLEKPTYLLSSTQLKAFRRGESIHQELDVKAEPGAYFISSDFHLDPQTEKSWMIIANVNQNHSEVAELAHHILIEKDLQNTINQDIEDGTRCLIDLNASSDGLQLTSDKLVDARHFSNTLFNIMRGGIFDNNYQTEKWDFKHYIQKASKEVARKHDKTISSLPDTFSLSELRTLAKESHDADFHRLCIEYLPLKFSRRHGDPSRPWNRFSINTRNEVDGSKVLDYEGNWRDIFQNWEALVHSYPDFIEGMIYKFLNASTFDGYNPYRVTKGGFDWETIEPDNPWSYIGYWGDHQIIYLLKFLEFIADHQPGKLQSLFSEKVFVYANVPYKIKNYTEILKNAKDTITFDAELDLVIEERRSTEGADGTLVRDRKNRTVHVNLIEKLLAITLAKLSNFIPEGGIWMNTQRPEWNDANNALVGNGVSMVTLYYLRRFLHFLEGILASVSNEEIEVSEELGRFYMSIFDTFTNHQQVLESGFSAKQRKQVLDNLGQAGSDYREEIYEHSFSSEQSSISVESLKQFVDLSLRYLEQSITANKRSDDLYHAYNLMSSDEDEVNISHLDEMLEGQVAVLSSKFLSTKETLAVLNAMKESRLYRPDQSSYMLYPNKELKGFMERNIIPQKLVYKSSLLKKLVHEGNNTIIEKDINGKFHFDGNFKNKADLERALDSLATSDIYKGEIADERELLLEIFEAVFNHKAFTGRSGTFYGYEGLGSIYWHMVSKLQLAIYESCVQADGKQDVFDQISTYYYDVRAGIGVHKSPMLYGAFPTDPYSHTPGNKGAQQPGMTGQVKEDIVSRFGELGVSVKDGKLHFRPFLLRRDEFLPEEKGFTYVNVHQEVQRMQVAANSLCFTYCQVPILYTISEVLSMKLTYKNGVQKVVSKAYLDQEISKAIFSRSGEVVRINVNIPENYLL